MDEYNSRQYNYILLITNTNVEYIIAVKNGLENSVIFCERVAAAIYIAPTARGRSARLLIARNGFRLGVFFYMVLYSLARALEDLKTRCESSTSNNYLCSIFLD